MGRFVTAKKKYSFAARFTDEYGARATFELAVNEYNAKRYDKASYWIRLYQQRYPRGTAIPVLNKMAQSISGNYHLPDIQGNKKPDMEKALFRYNKYSLSPNPHYWFVQLGSIFDFGSAREPDQNQNKIKTVETQEYALLANAGVGMGPIKQNDALAFGGYTYRQRWNTEAARINTFFEDFTDIEYFPFRGDLLIRSHELYGDYRQRVKDNIFFGVFGRLEMEFGGSSLIPGPEQPEVKSTTRISDTTLLIPWVGISYLDNYYTLFYLYLRKSLNSVNFEFSNKTYSLFGDDEFVMSFGISHNMDFPKKKLKVNAEAFQYEFIYNDYWLDYTRTGAIFAAEYEFYPRFFVRGLLGFYSDVYQLPTIKQNQCAYNSGPADSGEGGELFLTDSEDPLRCPRTDEGRLYGVGGHWNYSQFHRVEVSFTHVSNSNAKLKVYDRTKNTILFRLTWAFPSAQRVIRYVDRFADSAFTNEIE